MLEILGGRIEVPDFRRNWYQLVAFILFVIRLAHFRAQQEIHAEIQSYISDQTNPDSYLNTFNNPEYDTLRRYESAWLADAVADAYNSYWNLFTQGNNDGVDPSYAINQYLGKMLTAESNDECNLHGAFDFLEKKFANGELKLFQV